MTLATEMHLRRANNRANRAAPTPKLESTRINAPTLAAPWTPGSSGL